MIGVRADGRKEFVALTDGIARPPSRGPTCCATASTAAYAPDLVALVAPGRSSSTADSSNDRTNQQTTPKPHDTLHNRLIHGP
jgi:hypothetical protein